MKSASKELLQVKNLSHIFMRKQGIFSKVPFHALHDVSLSLCHGKTLGLIGESGSGKSTLARSISGLMPPTEGSVFIHGQSLYDKSQHSNYAAFRKSVCQTIQMIFQDPQSSLNPRLRIGESIAEPLQCLTPLSTKEQKERVAEMLVRVGLEADDALRYPHNFSGGQRQRIAILRALIIHPELVICDEPTSSLDSSIQAQVLNLLVEMQEEMGLSYLFISHDLWVIQHMSDFVAVMYAGTIVEFGSVDDVFNDPKHPYTQLLFSSAFGLEQKKAHTKKNITNAKSAPTEQKSAEQEDLDQEHSEQVSIQTCPFSSQCDKATPLCHQAFPAMQEKTPNHFVRCCVI